MSTNRYTVAGIVGPTAVAIRSAVWSMKRKFDDISERDFIGARDSKTVAGMMKTLEANAHLAPVIFYSTFIGVYEMTGIYEHCWFDARWRSDRQILKCRDGSNSGVALFSGAALAAKHKELEEFFVRSRKRRKQIIVDDSMLYHSICDCARFISEFKTPLLIMYRQYLGPSQYDDEIAQNSKTIPKWALPIKRRGSR